MHLLQDRAIRLGVLAFQSRIYIVGYLGGTSPLPLQSVITIARKVGGRGGVGGLFREAASFGVTGTTFFTIKILQ